MRDRVTRREVVGALAAGPIAAAAAPLPSAPEDWTLQQASEQLRNKKISPVELTRTCLERIGRLNPKLNAYITVMADQVMARAREAEGEIARGRWRGPLHGVPLGLKDLYDTAGVKTTCASAVFADRVPTEDAEVVARLKRAGAVITGKHNMHEFAYGATSIPSHFGAVRNPWDPERIAGGSSGGSAAAVAAGMCFGALGSDTGGSIRQPAAYCGLSGLKPTYGRVSKRGVVPLSWSLDHVGPICRTAADAAIMLEAIAGHDPQDPASAEAPVERYAAAMSMKVASMRLGVVRSVFFDSLDSQIESAFNAALEVFKKLTAGARDVELPKYATLPIVGVEAYAYHRSYLEKSPELYQPSTRQRLEGGLKVSAADYAEARHELARLRRNVATVFSSVDLLLTPTTPMLPVTIAEGSKAEVPGPGSVASSLRNTQPFDIFGLPTISIPCGFTRENLPVGLQITGPRFAESRVLALAHAYQQATDWHTRRPPA